VGGWLIPAGYDGSGDNVMSAGNQQERPSDLASSTQIPVDLGNYLSGFADGEASFQVSFVRADDIVLRRRDVVLRREARVSFSFSGTDDSMCRIFQRTLGCGTVRYGKDGVCHFEVTDLSDFLARVVPFFRRFPLVSKKRFDFEALARIARMMGSGSHLEPDGLREEPGRQMSGTHEQEITPRCSCPMESSEAIRQAPWSGTQG